MTKMLHTVFVEKTDNLFLLLFRYTFVGGIASLIDFSLLIILTRYAHIHYLLSASQSFLAGLVVNYLISMKWVFNHAKISNKKLEFISYATIGTIGLGFTELSMWTFTSGLNINYMLSKVITAVIVYLWDFLMRKYLLF